MWLPDLRVGIVIIDIVDSLINVISLTIVNNCASHLCVLSTIVKILIE